MDANQKDRSHLSSSFLGYLLGGGQVSVDSIWRIMYLQPAMLETLQRVIHLESGANIEVRELYQKRK